MMDHRSTSGFMFSQGIGAISWSKKKQLTIASWSIEAKNRAIWLKKLLKGLNETINDLVPVARTLIARNLHQLWVFMHE